MPKVEVYTRMLCPYCDRALALLARKGVTVDQHDISMGGPDRSVMIDRAGGRTTVPQIFINGRHVGGSDDLAALERSGSSTDCWRRADVRIAVLQMCAGVDPAANALVIEQAVRDAAAGGASMLFTPEMSGIVDRDRERIAANVRPELDDMVLRTAREAAAREGLWLALGSLAIAREDGMLANRSFLIDDRGDIRARYDKLHLFDVHLSGGESYRESMTYAPGEHPVVAETPWAPLGLSICYDLRFPALYQHLSSRGAQLLAVPSAFTVPTGRAHWHVLLRTRAIENAAFVVAAAQTGRHEDGRETFGHSLVVDPWGEVMLDMGTEPGLAFCELGLGAVTDVRARIPVIEHRRVIA